MNRQWVFIALLVTMAAAQAADAYRWVDANGVVHYSEAPPPPEVKAELVHLRGSGSTAGAAGVSVPNEPAKADDSKEAAANKPPGTLTNSEGAEKRCTDARASLEVLHRSGPVGLDNGTGKPQPLDDNARQQQIANAQTMIATFCK